MEEASGVFCASRTVEDWRKFQRKQSSIYFPRKVGNGATSLTQEDKGWELTLATVKNIPSVVEGTCLKLCFTMFDLEGKAFFGNTLVSERVQPGHEEGSWKCNADKTVHFWSRHNLEKTVVVVELVKVELEKSVETLEESIGWVPIPLNVLYGTEAEANQGKLFEIPLLEGTPRVLLFAGTSKGKSLGECKAIFSVRYNDNFLGACSRLVRDSCIVDSREIIPGCSRFDGKGKETFLVFDGSTPVAAPQKTPAVDIKVKNMHFSLPKNYIESVLAELLKDVEGWSSWLKDNFYVNVAAHNGRREIGGTACREKLKFMKLYQDTHLQLDTDITVKDVPEDEFIALVIELYVDLSPDRLHLGWLPISMFSDDGEGKQINCSLECGPGRLANNSPLLNWRATIAEDPQNPVFSPTVYCQVITGQRKPRVPAVLETPKAVSLDRAISSSAAARSTDRVQVVERTSEPAQASAPVKTDEPERASTQVETAASKEEEPEPPKEKDIKPEPPREEPPKLPPPQTAQQRKPKLHPIPTAAKEGSQKEGRPRPRPVRAPLPSQPAVPAPAPKEEPPRRVVVAVKKTSSGRPASAKAVKKDLGVSRATMAKMQLQEVKISNKSAGGQQGRPFPAKQENGKGMPDLEKERSDPKMVNEIVLQLLAYKSENPSKLESLYFTLNFFDFKESTTCKVALERSGESDVYMFKNASRGNIASPEGLTLKFKVDKEDPDGLAERKERLCEYLLNKKLQLNVWDAKSMFQYGFASVDLVPLLRQGKDVVEQLQEVEIRKVGDLHPEDSSRDQGRRESLKLTGLEDEAALSGGKTHLILRLINVGSEKDVEGNTKDSVGLDDTKRSLLKRPEVVMQELNINPNESSGSLIHQLIEVEKRRYKRKERYMGHNISDNYELGYKIRQKLHEDVCHVKLMKRENIIKSKLRQKLVGKKMLKARVGEVLFFEEKFVNPRGGNRTFRIDVSDLELNLVLRADEWSHLRSMKRVESASAPERDILDGNRLFLGSFDECYVPFKYCPLDSIQVATEKVIHVSLVCERTGVVESQIEILIEVHPCVVDQTMNLHTSEFSILKHSIPLEAGLLRSVNNNSTASTEVQSLRANDENVIVKVEQSDQGKEMVIKCSKSGTAPESREFLTFFYADKFQSVLLQVWKFSVTTVRKVDVSGLTGQTTISNLVVKGTATSQKVMCFTSHPDEIQVVPKEFTLISDSLSEVQVSFCPLIAGRLHAMLNIVNVETGRLAQSVLLAARGEDPPVSKTYELQVIAGTVHESKISYENAWSTRKTFSFKPAHPWLVKVNPGLLELEAGALGVVGISFRALDLKPGMYETLVFINDVDNNNEDCVRIQIKVLQNQ
ncbi:nephrocystin-4 [Chloropicon primus]|nr:nephrocystin-4 [Chloropicon primus]